MPQAQEDLGKRAERLHRPAALGCGRSDLRKYNLGDTVNLAIGQGDVQASPLQMAIAYAAIANGGKIVQPHLGLEIETPTGELVQRIERDPARKVKIDQGHLEAVRNGLHLAASGAGGTSADVFAAGTKTRTRSSARPARRSGRPRKTSRGTSRTSPIASRPIVVAVTVEEGGFGAAVAAPIACRMLARYYAQDASSCAAGAATSR